MISTPFAKEFPTLIITSYCFPPKLTHFFLFDSSSQVKLQQFSVNLEGGLKIFVNVQGFFMMGIVSVFTEENSFRLVNEELLWLEPRLEEFQKLTNT